MNSRTKELFGAADAIVLGAGITGLTTAITLQSLGFSVTIVAEKSLDASAPHDPRIATSYAMASAYPHNLKVKNLEQVSEDSQSVFKILNADNNSGIEIHELYEVFEDKPDDPPLGSTRMQMQFFDGTPEVLKKTIAPPARREAEYLWGWKFNTYFADMPKYLLFLHKKFKENGGILNLQKIDANVLQRASGRLFVNCLGVGSIAFAEDLSPAKILRGKQLLVSGARRVIGKHGLPLAYNYTPNEAIFPRGDGNPEYLHFFARSDGWVLGQTREPGILNQSGEWEGITSPAPTTELNGIAVPIPMIDLNREILSTWLDVAFSDEQLIARQGYRYYRDPLSSGVRLESEEKNGASIVHNYGHGGSGITMSWGCAIEAARMVSARLDPKVPRALTDFDQLLQNCVACTN